jgi:signal transduction histidine kinase
MLRLGWLQSLAGRASPATIFFGGMAVALPLSMGLAAVNSYLLIGSVPFHVEANAFLTGALVASLMLSVVALVVRLMKDQIDQRERAEQANRAKSLFLAAASHDLRQPLQALGLNYALIANLLPPGHPAVRMGCMALGKLTAQLDDLLDLARMDTGGLRVELADVSLAELFDEVIATQTPMAETKGLHLRGVPCSRILRTDRRLLERILANLVANAIRYTDRGGVLIGVRSHAGRPWIEVWDSGIGIKPEDLAVIFDEFHQLNNPVRGNAGGSGLGLAIVDRSSKALGLPIRVASQPGKGSVFAVGI